MSVGERRTDVAAIRWAPALRARSRASEPHRPPLGKRLVAELDLGPGPRSVRGARSGCRRARRRAAPPRAAPQASPPHARRRLRGGGGSPRGSAACARARDRPRSAWRRARRARLPPRTPHGRPPARSRRLGWTQRGVWTALPRAPGGGRVPRRPRPRPRAPVDGAALPDRRLLIRDRGEQRVREANLEPSSSTMPSCAAVSSASSTRSGLHAPR